MSERSIADSDSNIQFSEDKRRLHVLKARITDAGFYKCIARNAAGQSQKQYKIDVLGKN